MQHPNLEYAETYNEIQDAYNQWKMRQEKAFESISNHIDDLCKGSSPVAQKLKGAVPDDVWVTDENMKAEIFGPSKDVQAKLFGSHYDDAWQDRQSCKLFGKDFSYHSTSKLETMRSIVATVSQDDKAIVSGRKRVDVSEQTQFKTYLELHIKRLITCLPFINRNLFPGFQKATIWLSKVILNAIMYLKPLPEYMKFDDIEDGASKLMYIKSQFKNWGETVEKEPTFTFFPKTVDGLCKIVQMAKKQGKRIRMSGFRHSWTDLWADNDQIQIAMLPLKVTDKLKYIIDFVESNHPGVPFHVIYDRDEWANSEFVQIDNPQKEYRGEDGKVYANVRIGSAVCGLQVLEWLFERHTAGEKSYQLPLDVIMSLNSYGGKVSTMSHGSGLNHATLSDLVVKIEYVDANGIHQSIEDPMLLNAAAGSIGMLGILTHITFRMENATYATFHPKSVKLEKAIPPLGDTESYQEMVVDINSSFYCEWFWFYGCQNAYKNIWKDDGSASQYKEPLINLLQQEYQRSNSYLMGILQGVIMALHECRFKDVVVQLLEKVIPRIADAALITPKDPLTVLAFDAIHFRRGINYLPVRCMEFLIPVPKTAKGDADFTILQRAWWDIHELIKKYQENGKLSPMNLTLEARILSGSKVYLAPEYGNNSGTCSIEVLGTMLVSDESWRTFKNEVAAVWASYKDKDGQPLNVRPHWAKELPTMVGKKTCYEFIRDGHREGFREFKAAIERIAKMHGFTIADMRSRFSNAFLEGVFGPLWNM